MVSVVEMGGGGTYGLANALRRPTRHGALLDDDGAGGGVLRDVADGVVHGCHVGGAAGAHAKGLGGRVDGEEDHVGAGDAGGGVAGELQVGGALALVLPVVRCGFIRDNGAVARYADDAVQTGFVDRQMRRLPFCDAAWVAVDDVDCDGWVVQREYCGGWAPWSR